MGGVFTKEGKQTPEEIEKQRQVRTQYNNYLNTTQTNTTADVKTKALTPESGQAILTQLQAGFKWLRDNPTASINELYANYDAIDSDVKRIVGTDRPKREFKNTTTVIPSIVDTFVNEKKLTYAQENALKNLNTTEASWYDKNQATATLIDFSEETIKFNDKITEIVKDTSTINAIKDKINAAKNLTTSDVVSRVLQQKVALKNLESQTVDIAKGVTTVINTTLIVCGSLLLVVLCLLSGSLAANAAIGRHSGYRILYFIYGCIPFFAPFVIFYTIYRRISMGPLPYYGVLPISLEPATTTFGRYLWWPFFWEPDPLSKTQTDAFQQALAAITG